MNEITNHPSEWIEGREISFPPGTVELNGAIYKRAEDLGGVQYWLCDDEDLEPREELNAQLVRECCAVPDQITPATVDHLFRLQKAIEKPAIETGFRIGKEKGRDEIRAILRGLIGPDATDEITR